MSRTPSGSAQAGLNRRGQDDSQAGHLYSASLAARALKLARERGFGFLLRKCAAVAGRKLYAATLLRFRKPGSFPFGGKRYDYFFHPYNYTWDNERAVEIPLALEYLALHRGGRILEVGNVLSHYVRADWDIVDKFERENGVIPADAATFCPEEPYDLVISISTLEHVGFDDYPRDPALIPQAVANLTAHCLRPGGRMVVTVPVGYNPHLDRLLFEGGLGENRLRFLKRTGRYAWREASVDEVRGTGYATEFIEAGALAVVEWERNEK